MTKQMYKGSCQHEERPSKKQLKLNKKKKMLTDFDKRAGEPARCFQKESTKYYQEFPKSSLSDRQLYEKLLSYTLSDRDLMGNKYPSDHPTLFQWPKLLSSPTQFNRYCIRCGSFFQIDLNDKYVSETQTCSYHPLKPQGNPRRYACCKQGLEIQGCHFSDRHVTDSMKHPRHLVKTKTKKHIKEAEQFGVYGLDCEMSYTTNGLEVTKICVVGANGLPVYHTFVKPDHPILDYNTFFSGVTATDLKDLTVTRSDVQAYLLKLFNEKTIIVGHSLNSDFSALGLIHNRVVDTSVIYKRKNFPNQKPSLKELAREFLQRTIQESCNGHDCAEDARASLELALLKIEKSAPCLTKKSPVQPLPSGSSDADMDFELFKLRYNKYTTEANKENNEKFVPETFVQNDSASFKGHERKKKNNSSHKPSLKKLSNQSTLQESCNGHDSAEDARASLELSLLKIEKSAPCLTKKSPVQPPPSGSSNVDMDFELFKFRYNKYTTEANKENNEKFVSETFVQNDSASFKSHERKKKNNSHQKHSLKKLSNQNTLQESCNGQDCVEDVRTSYERTFVNIENRSAPLYTPSLPQPGPSTIDQEHEYFKKIIRVRSVPQNKALLAVESYFRFAFENLKSRGISFM